MKRVLRLALISSYYLVFRWLPPSTAPGGKAFRWIRKCVVGPTLKSHGRDINIEHGAFFGNGSRISIGNRSSIGISARFHGPVDVGDDVMMGPMVVIYALSHAYDRTDIAMID